MVAAVVAGVISLEECLPLVVDPMTLESEHEPADAELVHRYRDAVHAQQFQTPTARFVSGEQGEVAVDRVTKADFWLDRTFATPSKSAAGCQALTRLGCDTRIGIAARSELVESTGTTVGVQSLQSGEPIWSTLTRALARLFVHGAAIDWQGFDRDYVRRKVELPTYPFQRLRYWYDELTPLQPQALDDTHLLERFVQEVSELPGELAPTQDVQLGSVTESLRRLSPEQRKLLQALLEQSVEPSRSIATSHSCVDVVPGNGRISDEQLEDLSDSDAEALLIEELKNLAPMYQERSSDERG